MFPTADARGRVRGFGARAMRGVRARAEVHQHRRQRALPQAQPAVRDRPGPGGGGARPGARSSSRATPTCSRSTRPGSRNAVGIMGTSFTEEQVGGARAARQGARAVPRCRQRGPGRRWCAPAEIAAGPRARAARGAAARGPRPGRADRARGRRRAARARRASVPFVVFQVERILGRADVRSAEGRDRAAASSRPVLARCPPSVLREDLSGGSPGRLELSEARLEALLASGWPGGAGAPTWRRRGAAAPGQAAARAASARPGRPRRADVPRAVHRGAVSRPAARSRRSTPTQLFTSEPLRRAARHLAPRTDAPLSRAAARRRAARADRRRARRARRADAGRQRRRGSSTRCSCSSAAGSTARSAARG